MKRIGADQVRAFYKGKRKVTKRKAPRLDPEEWTLTNTPQGLGDCVILTEHFRACSQEGKPSSAYSPAPLWPSLVKSCPWAVNLDHPRQVSLCHASNNWDLGPGHMVDRARRLFGFDPQIQPCGALSVPFVRRQKSRVALHFESGFHSIWQRSNLHPRARQLYAHHRKTLRDFMTEMGDRFTWIEFGNRRVIDHERADDATGRPLEETIPLMAECEYHLGLVSGPMHLAAALGLKVITVLNFPDPRELMLPNLVDLGVVEQEWLYPQAVHLHQDIDSPHWPLFSKQSLARAFGGDVYPYWSTDTLVALR